MTTNPEGDPKHAFDLLMKKYKPKTAPRYIELEKQFANSKLSHDEEDPDEWITQLECIQTMTNQVMIRGKSDKSEVDVVLHILANVPESYEQQVNTLEALLESAPDTVTIESVRDELNARFARIQKNIAIKNPKVSMKRPLLWFWLK